MRWRYLLVLWPLLLGLLVALPGNASAAPASATLELVTVPATPQAAFLLDGRPLVTDAKGVVRATLPADGTPHTLQLTNPTIVLPGQTAEFVRWWGRGVRDQGFSSTVSDIRVRRDLRIQAGFRISYPVSHGFADQGREPIEPSRVASVTLRNDTGQTQTIKGQGPAMLAGLRPVLERGRVIVKPVTYSVQGVEIDGANAVTSGEQRFAPERQQQVTFVVPLRTVRFRAYDLLFGGSLGSAVRMTYPDGRTVSLPLDDSGQATVGSLVRGGYRIEVIGPGFTPGQSIELSRSQTVNLPVLSYADLVVLGGVLLVTAAGLLLARRRRQALRGGGGPAP